MEKIEINTESIQLDQLLKWAGIVTSGGEVKYMIQDGIISLNQSVVTEKRKKVYPGDILEISGNGIWEVVRK